jgi:hypothetical protein
MNLVASCLGKKYLSSSQSRPKENIMSLVILNDKIASDLAVEVLDSLYKSLKAELEFHTTGTDRLTQISEICTEITNVSRQIQPKVELQ